MRARLDRLVEQLCMFVTCASLGAALVSCTAAQRQHAATALEVVDAGCLVAELVAEPDGRLRAVCLAADAAQRVLEQLGRAGASGAAGAAGVSGAAGAAGAGGGS